MLRTIAVCLLALGWVLLTSHCRIEAMPGFDFLRCETEAAHSHEGGDPCREGGCCSVESARYHAPRQQELHPVIVVAVVPVDPPGLVERSLPREIIPGLLTAAPPELPASWRFSRRTALPPRAPSSAC